MNVMISPNAFKGTLKAREAGEIIQQYIEKHYPEVSIQLIPIADGGDGTCELLTELLGLERKRTWALDPYGRPIACNYGWDEVGKKAYIDISSASGLGLLGSEKKDPYTASTFGTGLVIREAVSLGAEEIVLGLGGSATIDLGIGILASLGVVFLDDNGRELTKFIPEFLSKIRHIQKTPSIPKIRFNFLCDVKNNFFGHKGAIPIFGPQKGLSISQIPSYEALCQITSDALYLKQKKTCVDKAGFGAAGGVALGLSAFFESEINFGSTYFFEQVNLKTAVDWADLVITGEGKYDNQSAEGKACFELLKLARNASKKIILITSGNEVPVELFDQILTLPDLDFSDPDVVEKSRKNLVSLLEKDFSLD